MSAGNAATENAPEKNFPSRSNASFSSLPLKLENGKFKRAVSSSLPLRQLSLYNYSYEHCDSNLLEKYILIVEIKFDMNFECFRKNFARAISCPRTFFPPKLSFYLICIPVI